MFRFQSPYFFLFLIPLAILIFVLEFRRPRASIVFSDVSQLRSLPKTFVQYVSFFVPWFFYLGTFLLIVALARPQSGKEEYRIRSEGIAMMMCVDRSGSMKAVDFKIDGQRVNRLQAVKKTFRDFVLGTTSVSGVSLPGRKDDMIGLLAFGGYVDAYCPLTLDHATLVEMLDQIQIPEPIFDRRGNMLAEELIQEESLTAIGDALAQAVERIKDTKAKSKVIILLSDGDQTFGTLLPKEGAEAAKAFGIKIYTIGIGSTGTVPVVLTNRLGQQITMNQNLVIDEDSLREVAETTGGLYFNAKNTQALERVYAEIDKLEKTEHEGRIYTEYTELFRWPLLWGLSLVLVNLVLANMRFRRIP